MKFSIAQKYFTLTLALLTVGCSSLVPKKDELMQSPTCTVWKDGLLGSRTVLEVEGEVAKQKLTCWVMNTFACQYTDYTFRTSFSDQIISSLPPADKTIATLKGNTLTIEMTGAHVPPFDLKDGVANYVFQGPIGPNQNMTVEYNKACTTRQAALGLLTMVAK